MNGSQVSARPSSSLAFGKRRPSLPDPELNKRAKELGRQTMNRQDVQAGWEKLEKDVESGVYVKDPTSLKLDLAMLGYTRRYYENKKRPPIVAKLLTALSPSRLLSWALGKSNK